MLEVVNESVDELGFDEAGCVVVPDLKAADVVQFRESLNMTQEQFAIEFDIPLSTLRKWEQNRSKPVISQARLVFYNKLFDEKAKLISQVDAKAMKQAA